MVSEYARRGFDLVGVVGHDAMPSVPTSEPITVLRGVEHEIDKASKFHVVEFPGFSFIAHPGLTWPEDTHSHVEQAIRELDVDGVEKINRGVVQYPGHISGVVEIGNDDAHNRNQVGSSYSIIDSWPPTTTQIRNPGVPTYKRWAGRALQATSLVGERLMSSGHE